MTALTRSPTNAAIGERIRKCRKDRRLTMKQIAERAGMAEPYVCKIERGGLDIRLSTLRRVAEALGVDARELMEGM